MRHRAPNSSDRFLVGVGYFAAEPARAPLCTQQSSVNMGTTIANHGEWDFLYANALLEPDANRLRERITAAEAAINERLKALADGPSHSPERAALTDALRALHALPARRRRGANPISYGIES